MSGALNILQSSNLCTDRRGHHLGTIKTLVYCGGAGAGAARNLFKQSSDLIECKTGNRRADWHQRLIG